MIEEVYTGDNHFCSFNELVLTEIFGVNEPCRKALPKNRCFSLKSQRENRQLETAKIKRNKRYTKKPPSFHTFNVDGIFFEIVSIRKQYLCTLLSQYFREAYRHEERKGHPRIA